MAGKQAIVFMLDCSGTMAPYMQQAKDVIAAKASQLLMASKMHEMALILCGVPDDETQNHLNDDDETGYLGVKTLVPLSKGSGDLLRALKDVEANEGDKADYINAMVVAVDVLKLRTARKKYTRHVYFFTDCMSECKDPSDLPDVVEYYENKHCLTAFHVVLCGESLAGVKLEDMEVDGDGDEEEEREAQRVKQLNEKMLRSVAKKLGSTTVTLDAAKEAVAGTVITARPVATKLAVSIGSKLKLRCLLYKRVAKKTTPSLSKESRQTERDPEDKESGKVTTERLHHSSEELGQEVKFEHQLSAVRYGNDFIPHELQGSLSMDLQEKEPSIKVLGFVKRDRIPFSYFMSEALVLKGETPTAAKALASFSKALHEGDVAVIRLLKSVRSKPQPVLACMMPDDDAYAGSSSSSSSSQAAAPSSSASSVDRRSRLIVVQIPFGDDLRNFTFPSFKFASPSARPTSEQCQAMGALVDSMMLPTPADKDEDPLRAGLVSNPFLLRYQDAMVARLMDPEGVLPPLSPELKAMCRPAKCLVESSEVQSALQQISKDFSFQVVDAGSASKKKKMFYSDLVVASADNPEGLASVAQNGGGAHGAEDGGPRKKAKVEYLRKIGTGDPLADFRLMLEAADKWAEAQKENDRGGGNEEQEESEGGNKPPSVEEAVEQMKETVRVLVEEGGSDAHKRKAVKCCEALRAACVARKLSNSYNTFMLDVKDRYKDSRHGAFWEMLAEAGVGLVGEAEDDTVLLGEEEVAAFFKDDDEGKTVQATQGVLLGAGDADDEDDFD